MLERSLDGPCAELSVERQNDIWIEVTPSQRKFHRHPEDLEDDTFDPKRTTFEVVAWSLLPTPARLSPTLIPILLDRGVPEQALHGKEGYDGRSPEPAAPLSLGLL